MLRGVIFTKVSLLL